MNSAFRSLPAAYLALVPDLATAPFPDEVLATCDDCAMRPRKYSHPDRDVFDVEPRCCTFHPTLPNFLAGRILRDGGVGAERMRARIATRDAVTIRRINMPDDYREKYFRESAFGFGRDASLTCPFWIDGGGQNCTIHANRNSVCRTWHCRHVDGRRGKNAWTAALRVLEHLEDAFSFVCVKDGSPPKDPPTDDQIIDWYLWCAEYVDGITPARLERMKTLTLQTLVSRLQTRVTERDAPMPAVLVPSLRTWQVTETSVGMSGYSGWDMVETPRWIFTLLSKMDGQRTWRQALDEAEAELGQFVGDDLVVTMYRRGVIDAPGDAQQFGAGAHAHVKVRPGDAVDV